MIELDKLEIGKTYECELFWYGGHRYLAYVVGRQVELPNAFILEFERHDLGWILDDKPEIKDAIKVPLKFHSNSYYFALSADVKILRAVDSRPKAVRDSLRKDLLGE